MDATQKRRMWKVAAGHFVLSLLIATAVMFSPEDFNLSPDGHIPSDFLTPTFACLFLFLQPQLVFFGWMFGFIHVESLGGISSFLLGTTMLISTPFWSICFAWLFVKFDNWLNHFPNLGRKVF